MPAKRVTVNVAGGPPVGTAAHIRLTPALKESLLKALQSGEKVSVRVGERENDGNVISVGGREFNFRSVPERSCVLLQVPPGLKKDGPGKKVASVTHKLQVQRKLDAEEIDRVRKEKASVQARPKAVKLDSIPMKGPSEKTVVRRIIRPGNRAATAKKVSPVVMRPMAAGGRMGATSKMAGRTLGEKSPEAPKPAPKGRGGSGGGPSNQLGIFASRAPVEKVEVTSEAAIAAARMDDARMCLLALFFERPYSLKTIQQAVVDCYHKGKMKRDRIPPKEYIRRTVMSICSYTGPNKYSLKPEFHEEAEKFVQQNGGPAKAKGTAQAKNKRGNSKGFQAADAVIPGARAEMVRHPKATPPGTRPSGPSSRSHPQPPPPQPQPSPQLLPTKEPAPRRRLKRPRSTMNLAVKVTPSHSTHTNPDPSPTEETRSKSRKVDRPEAPPSVARSSLEQNTTPKLPAREPVERQPKSLSQAQGQGSTSQTGSRPVKTEKITLKKSKKKAGTAETKSAKPIAMTKKYVPSFLTPDALEEDWFVEYVCREPKMTEDIITNEDFEKAQEEYGEKYKVYSRLHNLIENNRRYFEGLMSQLENGTGGEDEQDGAFCQLKTDWIATGTLSVKWSDAFHTLHEELKSCRSKMEDFLVNFDQQR
ncbi:hypothetical protein BSKO_05752 [Bryopsis sp. KO-2023]|nr:hypothetical protein BSKO_05752 [Bryopsis sp. KO-2023]